MLFQSKQISGVPSSLPSTSGLLWCNGQLLSQLSSDQIRQAFRAADYSPEEVEEFSNVVQRRIKELSRLAFTNH
jgi:hypothetical protein